MTPIKQAAAKFNEEHGSAMTWSDALLTIPIERWNKTFEVWLILYQEAADVFGESVRLWERQSLIASFKRQDELEHLNTMDTINELRRELKQAEADKIEYGRKKWEEACMAYEVLNDLNVDYYDIPDFKP